MQKLSKNFWRDSLYRVKTQYTRILNFFRRLVLLEIRLGRGIKTPNPYAAYDEYIARQKEKTLDPHRKQKWLGEEWEVKVDGFREIFNRNWEYIKDKENGLCLGSRTGQEVKALQSLGIPAIGVDLVPFEPYTIEGDIHDLEFGDGEFGFLFSNVFDHSLYPEKFCSEMERVLRPGGIIILHLQIGEDLDEYTETYVYDPDKVVILFTNTNVLESRAIQHSFDSMDWELVLEKPFS